MHIGRHLKKKKKRQLLDLVAIRQPIIVQDARSNSKAFEQVVAKGYRS
jgi:hypothetical protein